MEDTPRKRQLLVVEDDDGLRRLICKSLRNEGLEIKQAANGADAVRMIESEPTMLVLLDQKLPDTSGQDIVEQLHARGVLFSFVMMTGEGDERLAVEMMKLGAADYLVKDIDFISMLPGVINRAFKNMETAQKLKEAEAEKSRLQAQLSQAQRLESVGRLAGGVAHDFNNMLGVIFGRVSLALDRVDKKQPVYEDLLEIKKAASRSAELTRQLLAFARKQSINPKVFSFNETVAGMLKMLSRLIGEDIELRWSPGAEVGALKMDPSQLDQILVNLCVNAADAIDGVGLISISSASYRQDEDGAGENGALLPGEYILLTVSDSGCGMDTLTVEQIFEPFFTTKEVGKGTGLGLATVYGIVSQNKGHIQVKSSPGEGSTFRIFLPVYAGEVAAEEKAEDSGKAEQGEGRILLVEDEAMVLSISTKMLENLGYSVQAISCPRQALEYLLTSPEKPDLLITDMVMPEMNGRELAEEVLVASPQTKVLFLSGYPVDLVGNSKRRLDQGVNFIQKPFTVNELAKRVREVLSSS